MKPRFWTEAEREAARKQYADGVPVRDIAAALGRSECSVRRNVRGTPRVTPRTGPNTRWRPGDDVVLAKLVERGMSHAAIAKVLGRTAIAVAARLSKQRTSQRAGSACLTEERHDPRQGKMYRALEEGSTLAMAARIAGYGCVDEAWTGAQAYGRRLTGGAFRLFRYDLGKYGDPATAMECAA